MLLGDPSDALVDDDIQGEHCLFLYVTSIVHTISCMLSGFIIPPWIFCMCFKICTKTVNIIVRIFELHTEFIQRASADPSGPYAFSL